MVSKRNQIKKHAYCGFHLYRVLQQAELVHSDRNETVVFSGERRYKGAFWGGGSVPPLDRCVGYTDVHVCHNRLTCMHT